MRAAGMSFKTWTFLYCCAVVRAGGAPLCACGVARQWSETTVATTSAAATPIPLFLLLSTGVLFENFLIHRSVTTADDATQLRRRVRQPHEPEPAAAVASTCWRRFVGGPQ